MRGYLVISGVLFGVVALAHLLRLIYGWQVQIATEVVPMWVSAIGLVAAGVLCVWAFALQRGVRGA